MYKCYICKGELPLVLAIHSCRDGFDYIFCLACYVKNRRSMWEMSGVLQVIAKMQMIELMDKALGLNGELMKESLKR